MLSKEQLLDQLSRFGPWMYRFRLTDEVSTPLHAEWLAEVHETRSRMIFPYLDAALAGRWGQVTCLDAACNEGYFAFEICRRGAARVLGFDARPELVEKANFIKEFHGWSNVRFLVDDIANLSPVRYGTFDLTLCLGLLYHLENPMDALRRIRAVTKGLCVIDTQVLRYDSTVMACQGCKENVFETRSVIGILEEKDYEVNPCASVTGLGFVPNRAALFTMLRYAGFSKSIQLTPPENCFEQYATFDRIIVVAEV